ncbi:hypothetical protein A3K86_14720 [Photobacterium jeanii]|uniref:BIG2 domain-containing protein n=1 Tax=Photobacterium jeanii TaxID=858640 RepID=A0A178K8Z7_9GAMM|nr:Ig-like domain-containing protein [Photobacterium jeanii]OAN13808.1 hypothetical protein A3K86_14720 [Photobacterium jeanii]PST92730.1 hypothetical protein C9I91_06080 [Photobacterium jeanii]
MRKILVLCSLIILGCNTSTSTSTSTSNDIESIEISYENIVETSVAKIPSHSSLPFIATAHLKNKSERDVTRDVHWISSDTSVATVSNTGLATGISEGVAKVIAQYQEIDSNTIELTVTGSQLWNLKLDFPQEYSGQLPKGVTFPLTVVATYDDMSKKEVMSDLTWTTSNPAIVTVSKFGVVKGNNLGTATVTAILNGKESNKLIVNVTDAVVTNITIQPNTKPLHTIPVGFTDSMVAVGTLSDGSELELKEGISWSSDNELIASVTKDGVVQAHNEGEVKIRAQYANTQSEPLSLVTSNASLDSIALSTQDGTHNLPKGNKLQIKAVGTFSDGYIKDITNDLLWSSDDEHVALISHSGMVSGIEIGQASISASFANIKTDFNLDVNNAPTHFEIVTLGSSTSHSSKTVTSGTILVEDKDITLVYRGDHIEVYVHSTAQYIQAEDAGHDFVVRRDEHNNIVGFSGYVKVYRTSKEHMYDDSFYTTFFAANSTRQQAIENTSYSGELLYSVLSEEDNKPLAIKHGRVTLDLSTGKPSCNVSGRDVYTCVDAEFYGKNFMSKLYDKNRRRQGDLYVKFYGENAEFASGYIYEEAYQGNAKKVDVFILTKQP